MVQMPSTIKITMLRKKKNTEKSFKIKEKLKLCDK